MSIEVRLPLLSETSTVRLSKWLKREGDRVEADEPIAEVETEKTNAEIVAPGSGVLERILVPAGDAAVEPDAVLAIIVAESSTTSPTSTSGKRPDPQAPEVVLTYTPAEPNIAATPLARVMAQIAGLDLATIPKSNPAGRVVKADVQHALGTLRDGMVVSDAPARARTPDGTSGGLATPREEVAGFETSPTANRQTAAVGPPMSALKRVTAERLTVAKQTIPHFYLEIDCDVEALLSVRAEINKAWSDERVTVTDFAVRALAVALRRVPVAHCTWTGTNVRLLESVDIAVAVMTEHGLIAPIIRAADTKSLRTLSRELKMLTTKARLGRLEPGACSGGSCTISNLGMHGVGSLHAIINPPQSCIIGIGEASKRAVVRGNEIVARSVMTCTLSGDHRAMDGVTGAELLSEFQLLLEAPTSLVF